MEKKNSSERPEVYALRQNGGGWQISRREFLKAAAFGAAAIGIGNRRASAHEESLLDVCRDTKAHRSTIYNIALSVDGRYFVSRDLDDVRCWDFEKQNLLGKVPADTNDLISGYHDGKSCVFLPRSASTDYLLVYELPLKESDATRIKLPSPYRFQRSTIFDSSENMYTIQNDKNIVFFSKGSGYQEKKTLYEAPDDRRIFRIRLIDHEKKLFVQLGTGQFNRYSGFGVLELTGNSMTVFDGECNKFAILQERNQALIGTKTEYRLVSLEDGSVLWSREYSDAEDPSFEMIVGTAVTPDGGYGILLADYDNVKYVLCMISMGDGSIMKTFILDGMDVVSLSSDIVISPDSKKCVISINEHIFCFSLPDLDLIGCPNDPRLVDLRNYNQMEIILRDAKTGTTGWMTLPCGSYIPDGAVCSCNCVGPTFDYCITDTSGLKPTPTPGPHYWHPN